MYPGQWSASGFLAEGESLDQVIADDLLYLKSAGVTVESLAAVLQEVVDRHNQGANVIGDRFEVRPKRYFGYQRCPFESCTAKTDTDFWVHDRKTKQELKFSGLMPHLIATHHFFESPSVPYRVNPVDIIHMFGGIDFRLPKISVGEQCARLETHWRLQRTPSLPDGGIFSLIWPGAIEPRCADFDGDECNQHILATTSGRRRRKNNGRKSKERKM